MFIQIQSTECAAFCIHIIGTSIFFFFFFVTYTIVRGGERTSSYLTVLVKMIAFKISVIVSNDYTQGIHSVYLLTLEQALTFWSTGNFHRNDLLCLISSCFP